MRRGIDDESIVGCPERGHLALPVSLVTITHILENVAEHNGLSCGLQLPGAAFGTNLQIGINEELEVGVRQNHAANVAPVKDSAIAMWRVRCKGALQVNKTASDRGHCCDHRSHPGHLVGADLGAVGQIRIKVGDGRRSPEFINVFSIFTNLEQPISKRTVQGPCVQMRQIEMGCQPFRKRALAAGGRTVDRDDHDASPAVRDAPHAFIFSANPGKLVAMVAHPVTVTGAAETMPSVRNDMAIR